MHGAHGAFELPAKAASIATVDSILFGLELGRDLPEIFVHLSIRSTIQHKYVWWI
eukprot:SAG31_NODE_33408_length_344_cov_0.726531_1_plen_54_part_01